MKLSRYIANNLCRVQTEISKRSWQKILPWLGRPLGMALLASLIATGILFYHSNKVTANTVWRFPWPSSVVTVVANVNRGWHTDGYGLNAIDFSAPSYYDVLAPVDSTVIAQCDAGNNHRAIKLQASDGQIYSLLHVTATNIYAGRQYRQGEKIGTVAADKPNNDCAVSYGPHLHLGFPARPFTIDGYTFTASSINSGVSLISTNSSLYALELKATPPSSIKQCIEIDGTKIGVLPDATKVKVNNCRIIQEQQFSTVNDGGGYYRLQLKATPPSGAKQCIEVDGTKVGVVSDADKAKAASCSAIQEQQFKIIDDGGSYYRFELKATPPSGVKQCLEVNGTKIGVLADANRVKVGNCQAIQEQQFKQSPQ